MAEDALHAGFPVVMVHVGALIGSLTIGTGALIAIMTTSGDPLVALAKAAVLAALWGGFMWFFVSRREVRQFSELPRVTSLTIYARSAVIRGAVGALLGSAAVFLIEGFFAWAWGDTKSDVGMGAGFVLGLSVWAALSAADLRRWQKTNGAVVVRGVDRPRFVFRKGNAACQAALVESSAMSELHSETRL